jgi:hypothetical protein
MNILKDLILIAIIVMTILFFSASPETQRSIIQSVGICVVVGSWITGICIFVWRIGK